MTSTVYVVMRGLSKALGKGYRSEAYDIFDCIVTTEEEAKQKVAELVKKQCEEWEDCLYTDGPYELENDWYCCKGVMYVTTGDGYRELCFYYRPYEIQTS